MGVDHGVTVGQTSPRDRVQNVEVDVDRLKDEAGGGPQPELVVRVIRKAWIRGSHAFNDSAAKEDSG